MSDVLVRNLDSRAIDELRARAKHNQRSAQGEMKSIIEDATRSRAAAMKRLTALSDAMLAKTAGRSIPDSAELIRTDRER